MTYHLTHTGILCEHINRELFWTLDRRNIIADAELLHLETLDTRKIPYAADLDTEPTELKTLVRLKSVDGVTPDIIVQRLTGDKPWYIVGALTGFTWSQINPTSKETI